MMIRPLALALLLATAALPGAAAAADAGVIEVTPNGLGPINASTPFTEAALQPLFPRATLTVSEAYDMTVITIRGPDDLLIYVYGDDQGVYAATASGASVRGPKGEKVGDAMSSIQNNTLSCRLYPQATTCYSQDMRMIDYTVMQPVGVSSPILAIGWRLLTPRR